MSRLVLRKLIVRRISGNTHRSIERRPSVPNSIWMKIRKNIESGKGAIVSRLGVGEDFSRRGWYGRTGRGPEKLLKIS